MCFLCPLKVMFSFSLFQTLCQKGKEWGSKWGLCTSWGPLLCLCRHLCIHADTATPDLMPCVECRVSGWSVAWLELGCTVRQSWTSWQLHCNPKSGLLVGHCLSKGQQWPTPTHWCSALGMDGLCIARLSIFPGPESPRFCAPLWSKMHGARVFTPIGPEEYAEAAVRTDVSPPWERNRSWVELRSL